MAENIRLPLAPEWVATKTTGAYTGTCIEHGNWENWIEDMCVFEQWQIEYNEKHKG